jgi:hypothetical protein
MVSSDVAVIPLDFAVPPAECFRVLRLLQVNIVHAHNDCSQPGFPAGSVVDLSFKT